MSRRTFDPSSPVGPRVAGALVLVAAGIAGAAALTLAALGTGPFLAGLVFALAAFAAGHVVGGRSERRRAGERMADLVDGIGPPVLLLDGSGRVGLVNRSAEETLRRSGAPLRGTRLDRLGWIGPTDSDRMASMVGRASLGETVRGDASLEVREGERIDLEIWMRPVKAVDGENLIAFSAVDVTRRREGEDVQIALMQELDHRMKNTLHMVQSMIRRTARSHGDVETFERALVGRIQAFARSHEILARERWLGAPLSDVVAEAVAVTLEDDDRGGRVDLSGARIWVEPRAALTLGLVVHELASNAALHGALSIPSGGVAVSWHIEEGDEPVLALAWREDGAATPIERGAAGFGRHFVERAIRHELDGEVRSTYGPGGLSVDVRVPLDRLTRRSVHAGRLLPGHEEAVA